ncbi:hypothetical protein F5878DRAFT_584075 [Lentinula raphanica]|uniref:Uncharacterized protein n=1 Tax=Lentinula raphanica TaxID=153919 RepID=A0AA38P8K1_9AGAR|nr:hypothetical protein F5878DRAFT_584075 [Lentinula raphanica]
MSQLSDLTPSNPSLERYRLDGMVLDGFTFGIYTLLSIHAVIAILRSSRRGSGGPRQQKAGLRMQSYILLLYVIVTFLLGAVGFAANARYTEDIWVNFRGQPGWAPEELIVDEFKFWYNRLASDSQGIMVWIMNALLLYRCFVTWNYARWVIFLMSTVYLTIVGVSMSVMILAQRQAIFSRLNIQLSFLALSCAYNILYTVLVAAKLFTVQRRVKNALLSEYAQVYTSIIALIVESAALYFIFDLLFLISFAIHSNTENLILLENCLIQGIAQLLIIIQVAQSRQHTQITTTNSTAQSNTVQPPRQGLAFSSSNAASVTITSNTEVALSNFSGGSLPRIKVPEENELSRNKGSSLEFVGHQHYDVRHRDYDCSTSTVEAEV